MAKAIRIHQHGGPEVLRGKMSTRDSPAPGRPSCATRPSG